MIDDPALEEKKELFFPLSKRKLIIMTLVSCGYYTLWWNFKNWLSIRDLVQRPMEPGWRAIFSVIFFYPLLNEVKRIGQEHGVQTKMSVGALAAAFILLTVAGKYAPLSFIFSSLAVLPILPVQDYINRLNKQVNPDVVINDRLTKGNWVWIVVGGSTALVLLYQICMKGATSL